MPIAKWFVAVVVLMPALVAHAQQPAPAVAPQQANRNEILIRTYNVADLLRLTTDYPLSMNLRRAVQMGLGGDSAPVQAGGSFGPRQAEVHIQVDSLILLLMTMVDPASWKDNGGDFGAIREVSSMLVITQTRANHDVVQSVLDEIRRQAGPMQVVTIRATWVQAGPGQLLTPNAEVTSDWMSKQKLYSESQISCFSGQTVHITSGTGKRAVEDLTPIVGTNAVAFDPQIQTLIGGVALQLAPQLIPGNESAILDVHAAVSELPQQDEQVQVAAVAYPALGERGIAERTTASVDRISMVRQEFQTTTRVPLRKKVIVGGMTVDPTSAAQAGRQLYLVVEIDTVK